MSAAFRPTAIQQFARLAHHDTAEDRHWQKFLPPRMVKEVGPVQSISFSPARPHDYVVTAGSHVHVYSGRTHQSKTTFSKFTAARSGSFRHDGKLLTAGDKSGVVKVFNANTKSTLRTFEGHRKDVRVTDFTTDGSNVFSAGEEGVVKLWDIPQEQETLSVQLANDYIQSGRTVRSNPSLLFLGGYDHKAHLLDIRSGSSQLELDHGASIESVWAFNSGTTLITAGQTYICIWDVLAGGKLVETVSNHRQTITGVCLDAAEKRLFSCGLDRMVKVYDVAAWNVVHSMKFSGQLLSIGVSPDESALAVGHSDGYVGLRIREPTKQPPKAQRKPPQRAGSYRYFMRGQSRKPSALDYRVEAPKRRQRKLKPHDKLLKSFRYSEALDAVFAAKTAAVVRASVIHELVQRDGLRSALSNRDDASLEPILRFVVAFISNPRYTRLLTHVAHLILDIYSPGIGMSSAIDKLFAQLSSKLRAEMAFQRSLMKVMGSIDALLAANQRDPPPAPDAEA